MKTVGLIVEYNPLHNGHVYHFQQSKIVTGADAVIAVMSGSFLQRGEPAIVSKWARAEMALHMGADLVLELPVAYSAQPAEWFAYGGVSALDATGVVDALCFGSESGSIGELQTMATALHEADRRHSGDRLLDNPDGQSFALRLREHLKRGASYPAAYAAAAGDALDEAAAMRIAEPNNSLGLHYLIALQRLNSRIRPFTIRRWKAGYHETTASDDRIASATAVRGLLAGSISPDAADRYVPPYTLEILRREMDAGRAPVGWEALFRPLFARLAVLPPNQLAGFADMTEGLENRIKRALAEVDPAKGQPFEQLLGALKTKRYTRTKLQRTLVRVLLNHSKETIGTERLIQGVPYLRVLGFSEQGRFLLKKMRSAARVPIVTKAAAFDHPFLKLDIDAATVHALCYRDPSRTDLFRDYYEAPIRLGQAAE